MKKVNRHELWREREREQQSLEEKTNVISFRKKENKHNLCNHDDCGSGSCFQVISSWFERESSSELVLFKFVAFL